MAVGPLEALVTLDPLEFRVARLVVSRSCQGRVDCSKSKLFSGRTSL